MIKIPRRSGRSEMKMQPKRPGLAFCTPTYSSLLLFFVIGLIAIPARPSVLPLFCGGGQYVSYNNTCENCSIGTYKTLTSNATSCTFCEPGRYADTTSAFNCTKCIGGTYSEAVGGTNCTNCSAGKYSNLLAAPSRENCAVCGEGKVAPSAGSTNCTLCPAGKYNDEEGDFAEYHDEWDDCGKCTPGDVSSVCE